MLLAKFSQFSLDSAIKRRSMSKPTRPIHLISVAISPVRATLPTRLSLFEGQSKNRHAGPFALRDHAADLPAVMPRYQDARSIIGMRNACAKQRSAFDNGGMVFSQFQDSCEWLLMREPAAKALSVLGPKGNPRLSAILDDVVSEPGELFEGEGRFVIQSYDPSAHALRSLMPKNRQTRQRLKLGPSRYPGQQSPVGTSDLGDQSEIVGGNVAEGIGAYL
jgi:hypothetical protein